MKLIEPGLLQIFRIFTAVQLALLVLTFMGAADNQDVGNVVFSFFSFIQGLVLLVYLSWGRLERWLGRWYLPLALLVATTGPIFARAWGVLAWLDAGVTGEAAAAESGALVLWLSVPLILVSAQYGIRAMLVFNFGAAILEIVLAMQAQRWGGPLLRGIIQSELGRLIIFFAVGYIIGRLFREQRQQRSELEAATLRLAEHATTLEQLAISRERNRMARELHDTLAHTLSAVALQLEGLSAVWDSDPQVARATLETVQRVTREGLDESRRALYALRSNPVEDLGLVLAIQNLAQSTAERIGVELTLDVPDHRAEVAPEIAHHVYRIAEEALSNVVRHANASTLRVSLHQRNRKTVLAVTDDGIGFDNTQSAPTGHYGMIGMRERALLCHGHLTVESEPGVGTKVELQVKERA